ncbi:MAG: 4Fe-4S dicluster domain-containing protein [Gemmataceae bacterium]
MSDVDCRILPKPRLNDLIRLLADEGLEVIGPRIEQGAIVYAPLKSANDLPIGWTDRQAPGSYRIERRDDSAFFGFAVGPHSGKKYLFPPELRLWQAKRTTLGFDVLPEATNPPPRAILGVRACELHAIAVQDRVFLNRDGRFTDPYYAAARGNLFLIAVECEYPAATCFCTSMGTGPSVQQERIPGFSAKHDEDTTPDASGSTRTPLPMATPVPPPTSSTQSPSVCDLVLTELDDAFVARAISPAGQGILDRLALAEASSESVAEARGRIETAAHAMGRTLDVTDVRGLLHRNQDHPRWDVVAERCLSCTNCTLVCPTCFCSTVEDVSDLELENAERIRRWDSCFNPDFARVHGGNFRPSVRGRYRQWLTHKFASWFDQFDLSGCVGCGRCITWCPVGIDVTEEIGAIRGTEGQQREKKP